MKLGIILVLLGAVSAIVSIIRVCLKLNTSESEIFAWVVVLLYSLEIAYHRYKADKANENSNRKK